MGQLNASGWRERQLDRTGSRLLPSRAHHCVDAKGAMEGYKVGDGGVSLAFGKYYPTSRMERGLQQGSQLKGVLKMRQVGRAGYIICRARYKMQM